MLYCEVYFIIFVHYIELYAFHHVHLGTNVVINGIILRHKHLPKRSIQDIFANKPVASKVNF